MSKIIIQSEQVYFKLICYDDIDNGWLDWINNPTLNKYLVSSTITRSDLIRYLDDSKPPLVYMFAVCLIENDPEEPPPKKRKTEHNLCAICCDKPAEYCFVPCGHKSLCHDCQSNKFNNNHCIICNQKYTMIMRVFNS